MAVYDAKDREVVLFGGGNATSGNLGDTWVFQNGTWTNITPTPSPPAEIGGAMAYDGAAGYVLLYADGYGGDDSTWSFSAGKWTNLSVSGPTTRSVAVMTYDAGDHYVVLFGGFVNHYPYPYLNDTWIFNNGAWSRIHPHTAPSPRADIERGGLRYDATSGYVVFFGGDKGLGGAPYYNQTWAFAKGNWTLLHPRSSPPARAYQTMAFDPVLRGVVMFGGLINRAPTHDMWIYTNGSWRNITSPIQPQGVHEANMVFDDARGSILLFGGDNISTYFNQTWAYQ